MRVTNAAYDIFLWPRNSEGNNKNGASRETSNGPRVSVGNANSPMNLSGVSSTCWRLVVHTERHAELQALVLQRSIIGWREVSESHRVRFLTFGCCTAG